MATIQASFSYKDTAGNVITVYGWTDSMVTKVKGALTDVETLKTSVAALPVIDDTAASTSGLYSSSKVEDLITTAKQAVKDDLLDGAGTAYDTLKELGDLIVTNADAIASLKEIAAGHVRFDVAQELTDAQKTQARTNIGALGESDLSAGKVIYTSYGFATVQEALDSVLYEDPVISSFTNSVGTVEKGATVDTVTLTWATNKTPSALTLNGETIDASLTTQTLTGLALTANTSYTLVMTDEKSATATKTTSINFLNGVYYGTGTVDADGVNDAFVQSLTKKLASSAKASYSVTAGEGEYIYFAFPASFGTPTFSVGGFDGGFELLTTFDYTNVQGHTESYLVFRSENANLGATTVTLK